MAELELQQVHEAEVSTTALCLPSHSSPLSSLTYQHSPFVLYTFSPIYHIYPPLKSHSLSRSFTLQPSPIIPYLPLLNHTSPSTPQSHFTLRSSITLHPPLLNHTSPSTPQSPSPSTPQSHLTLHSSITPHPPPLSETSDGWHNLSPQSHAWPEFPHY